MAITKIHAIKSTLGKALAYIENPDKTDGQMLVSGYNCEPQTASIDFEMTAVLAHKARNLKRKRSTNLAYHLIQSFSPEDAVTPEQAHELGKKLAFEYTGGKYEYVVATHIDKGHIHNHIMINAVSFYDYKKLRTVPYRTARQIRDISDRLCMEAHLSVIDDPQKIGQLYPENAGKKKSVSNRTEIRKRLNFCLERATDYSQFLSMAKGLEITPTIRGKHISYLLEGAGQSVRDNSLSDTDTFTYAGICARLSDNAQEQKYLRKTITGILRSATGMADFADKLKTAGIETKVKKATGQVLYRATVLDGAWVPEDALGSEFTSEGIEYALKNGKMQITEDAEITLLDRYVAEGGHLIATFRTGFADEQLKIHHDVQPHLLGRCLGIHYDQFTYPKNVRIATTDGRSALAHDWMELVTCDTATPLAHYDHPSWGSYAAVTENTYQKGSALYLGTFFDDKLLESLLVSYLTRHGYDGLSEDTPQFPLIVKRGTNDFGKNLCYYFNYSGEPQTMTHTGNTGTELLTDTPVAAGAVLSLDPWGLAIVES